MAGHGPAQAEESIETFIHVYVEGTRNIRDGDREKRQRREKDRKKEEREGSKEGVKSRAELSGRHNRRAWLSS